MTSATKKRKQLDLPVAQFIAIIVLSLSVFLIIDFGRRAATGYRVHREEDKLQLQLQIAREKQQLLLDRIAYVKTDAYVEEMARNELKWSRPGETVVVIMPTPQAGLQTRSLVRSFPAISQAETPFQAWLNLFFQNPSTPDPSY